MNGKSDTGRGEIVFYQGRTNIPAMEVRLEKDTVWLSQRQMSELFEKDTDTIGLHTRNVFKEGELDEASTTEESSVVQQEGKRQICRNIRYYNLDVIISVGYRVRSLRGTQFRIWATGVLKEHLVKGYTENKARLRELNRVVKLIADTAGRRELSGDEARALLSVVGDYNRALDLLDDYDHQRVTCPRTQGKLVRPLEYAEAQRIVARLRERFGASSVFGIEKDKGMASALGAVMQTACGREVYPSLEEKAANLLYFLVKNHAFVDGNKRIAAALFLWFLEINGALTAEDGTPRVNNATLVAVTLMIAASQPVEKEILVSIVTHLLSGNGGQ